MLGSAGPTEVENIFEDQQFTLLSLRNLGQVDPHHHHHSGGPELYFKKY